jgi:DNA mismatch endonuclease, patch repair protein
MFAMIRFTVADVFSKLKRSEIMSRVRGRGNKVTELAAVKFFRRNRIVGWRRHRRIFGNPDFIFPKLRLAILVDGCFWHCCPKHSNLPESNRGFWRRKLNANKLRDVLVNRTLRKQGWRVLRIWEHELKRKNEIHLIQRIHRALKIYERKS